MSLVDDYIGTIRPKLNAAISDSLANEIADQVKQEISNQAFAVVYPYTPKYLFSRRYSAGGIADKTLMQETVSGLSLKVESIVGLQNLFGGNWAANVPDLVESGTRQFNMHLAGPRLYHEAADQELQGYIGSYLEAALRSRGF